MRRPPEQRRTASRIVVYSIGVLFLSLLLPWRYDIFPSLLTIVSFLCLLLAFPLPSGFMPNTPMLGALAKTTVLPLPFVLYNIPFCTRDYFELDAVRRIADAFRQE